MFFSMKGKKDCNTFLCATFLNDKLSKWPILFYCVKRFLQIIENIVDIFCTDGKTDGVWLDSCSACSSSFNSACVVDAGWMDKGFYICYIGK